VTVGLDVIDQLTGGRIGTFDVPCPTCGPYKRSARNRRRPVLRVYRLEPNFAGYHCARCGDKGAALDRNGTPPDPMKLAKARAEAAERERIVKADRLGLARWLWAKRKPIGGSIAETYLRSARGYGGRLPETLGFLPGRGDVFADDDKDGRRHASELAGRIRDRGIEARLIIPNKVIFK
jgi:hypothetical protein